MISPSRPVAVMWKLSGGTAWVIGPNGTPGPPLPLPRGSSPAYWTRNGEWLACRMRVREAGEAARETWLAVDTTNSRIIPLAERPEPPPAPAPEALRIRLGDLTVKDAGGDLHLRPLWLEKSLEDPAPTTGAPAPASNALGARRVLLAKDCDSAQLAPGGGAVVYLNDGAAWVRPLIRAPKRALELAQQAAMRVLLMSNARQVGLAVAMFTHDHERIPGAEEPVSDLLGKYLGNEGLLAGFVYTYSGGLLKDVEDPRKAVLGYVPGPGGRAVVFVDGHAEWQKE